MSIAAASAIISALGLFQKAWADGSKADREAEKDRAKLLREAAQALRILSEQAEHLLRNQDLPSFAILNIARQCRLLENLSRWADLDSEASALVRRWAGTIRVQPALLIAKSSQLSEALKGQALDDDPELTLPHPRAQLRAFVLVPWLAVDPDAELPGHGRVAALIAALPADEVAAVVPL